jgi:ribonucleoside-diphosphate reductase alpha chain
MIRGKVLEYFNGDELAASTWQNKYAFSGEETPDDMHRRMAKEFAKLKNCPFTEDYIYKLFKDFKYVIPGGSIMSSLGSYSTNSLSNCFVIDSPEDNYTSIMKARTHQIHLMKRRGGVGYDLSNLRPAGSPVNNAARTSTGMHSFMEVCSGITKEVAQGGRRGALMLSADIRHPDSLAFIEMKQDLTKVTGANVSVKVTDDFMLSVEADLDYYLTYPVGEVIINSEIRNLAVDYDRLYPINDKQYVKKVRAKELWDKLIQCAHNTAEPGILFIDRIHDYSPDGNYDDAKAISTNPCGEIPLGPYDSCRLMHINFTSFVKDAFTKDARIDFDVLYKVAYDTMILADLLVDLEIEAVDRIIAKAEKDNDPVEAELWKKINETAIKYRRTGVGFTGLADTIAMLGLRFGSEESLAVIEEIMKTKMEAELFASIKLAADQGPFPGYNELNEQNNTWFYFVEDNFPEIYEQMKTYGRRNLSFSTVAPTGTVSIMAGVSSGIEPVFMPYYMRRRKVSNSIDRVDFIDAVGEKFTEFAVIHPMFKKWMIDRWEGTDDIVENFTKERLQTEFKESPWYGSTSPEIPWQDRIAIQQVVQNYTTHAISSTINLPENTTKEEIGGIYSTAWEKGLKGITVYRDGSRSGILINNTPKDKVFKSHDAPKRPKELEANLHITKSKGNTYAVVIGLFENKPYEVFVFNTLGEKLKECSGKIVKIKRGHYSFIGDKITIDNLNESGNSELEKASALYTSMLLRHGADIHYVIKTAKKINDGITSFVSAMCRILSKYDTKIEETICPECGGKLVHEAGCATCKDCGYSRC